MSNSSFLAWMTDTSARLEDCLQRYLELAPCPAPILKEAMIYATLNGGKRIRPLLVYATGYIFDAPLENLDLAALAIELIHSYSLVHDDLPAMDNADLRRGKASCYKAFGEDMAILAGDALQTAAFAALAQYPAPLSAESRIACIQSLTQASGAEGMVGGQTLDMLNTENKALSETELLQLYQLKTGALLEASVKLAIIVSPVKEASAQAALDKYAENISLAFQIQDDILDIEGTAAHLGKPCGTDKAQQKITYPAVVGMPYAKTKVSHLFQQAYQALAPLGTRAHFLKELTEYVAQRNK